MFVPNFMRMHPIVVETFTQNHKCEPRGGTRGKVKRSPKSIEFILWGPSISAPNFMEIHSIVVEVF